MELAYRLAVDDAPYIKYIRSHMIVLITPVVEVDGRDRMVDIYKWHKANPGKYWPRLLYWGHYVAHDNNRDAMGMTLALTRNVLDTYIDWHAQVLHDLHESVPFLYDNTVGDGPYNAWVDPTLADEWAELGWNNVAQMQSFGMPGVFTHGDFDTWSPGYLMFLAGMHNGISRLYETFGNGGADTEKRILPPEEYSAHLVPPEPPAAHRQLVAARQQQLRSKPPCSPPFPTSPSTPTTSSRTSTPRASAPSQKPSLEGPAAYVIANDDAHANRIVELLKVLQRQHVEIQQLSAPAAAESPPRSAATSPSRRPSPPAASSSAWTSPTPASPMLCSIASTGRLTIPQKHPYDDTGWSFSQLFNLKVTRVTDAAILKAEHEARRRPRRARRQARPAPVRSWRSPTPARPPCWRSCTS